MDVFDPDLVDGGVLLAAGYLRQVDVVHHARDDLVVDLPDANAQEEGTSELKNMTKSLDQASEWIAYLEF